REETAALIETMADGVVAADARRSIVTLNHAARRLLGYGPDDPVPSLAELFHEKAPRDLVEAVLGGREAEPSELEPAGRGLLDLSRIESGRWQPSPARTDVAALAREAWASFAERAAERRVALAVDAARAGAISADPDALRQVFTNLFDNALRHTPPGGRITVAAEPAPDGVTILVTDTGSGVAPEHLPRIFERFYRADPGRSR